MTKVWNPLTEIISNYAHAYAPALTSFSSKNGFVVADSIRSDDADIPSYLETKYHCESFMY